MGAGRVFSRAEKTNPSPFAEEEETLPRRPGFYLDSEQEFYAAAAKSHRTALASQHNPRRRLLYSDDRVREGLTCSGSRPCSRSRPVSRAAT